MPTLRRFALGLALLGLVLLAVPAAAEDDPAPPPPAGPDGGATTEPEAPPRPQLPGDREFPGDRRTWRTRMWPAPTAEDWAKPVLIPFQRTWDDAVAVAKEENKPILVCINMDGEIASEHYAGVRYRQPEVAKLYEPYVCVIASVYRHNPRDHDDEGNRILCPRFGSVTCGEHIAIEPVIYEKYCDGKRIAPRHIMVDLNDEEAFDVYYVNDTAGVFEAIYDGAQGLPEPRTIVRGDRPVVERVASRALADRMAVEEAYRNGGPELRQKLLEAAAKHPEAEPLELLRLAVFGLDADLGKQARDALAQTDNLRATELISESLQVPMDAAERDKLIGALKRLGEESPLARWLAGVHQGLATRSSTVKVREWSEGVGGTYPAPTPDADTLVWRAEEQARAAADNPEDPAPRLELAEASLKLAGESGSAYPANPRLARRLARASYEEAQRAAKEAEALGASGWRVDMVLALSAYYLDEIEDAYARAEKAMKELPAGDTSWQSMALVTVFAESRWKAIKEAVKEKKDWPAEWLADLHAAYAILLQHPLGTEEQVLWHYGFLEWLGADHRARRVLEEGIRRFPSSAALHERLIKRLLEKRGADELEGIYRRMAYDDTPPSPALAAFAGDASVAAAEHHRRTRGWEQALASYERAVERYERAKTIDATWTDYVAQRIALALAGQARVAYELGDDESSLQSILAALARSPDTAGTKDGMGITPGETAQMLLTRLRANEKGELAAMLEGALSMIDPELLQFDREE